MAITHHVTGPSEAGIRVRGRVRGYSGEPSIRFDEPAPLGENHAPNAAAVPGAVGDCLLRRV